MTDKVSVTVRSLSRGPASRLLTDADGTTFTIKPGEEMSLSVSPALARELREWSDARRGDLEVIYSDDVSDEAVDAQRKRASDAVNAALAPPTEKDVEELKRRQKPTASLYGGEAPAKSKAEVEAALAARTEEEARQPVGEARKKR